MPYKDEKFRKAYDRNRHRVGHDSKNRAINKDNARKRRIETKLKVLSHYGLGRIPHCCWPGCEVVDVDILCLDHVNDDGGAQRRYSLPGNVLYEYLVRNDYPEGYQTLCANHNLKKEILRRRIAL